MSYKIFHRNNIINQYMVKNNEQPVLFVPKHFILLNNYFKKITNYHQYKVKPNCADNYNQYIRLTYYGTDPKHIYLMVDNQQITIDSKIVLDLIQITNQNLEINEKLIINIIERYLKMNFSNISTDEFQALHYSYTFKNIKDLTDELPSRT